MLDKFLENKEAIIVISREMGLEFTVVEWENITNFCSVLAPINDAIVELQKKDHNNFVRNSDLPLVNEDTS